MLTVPTVGRLALIAILFASGCSEDLSTGEVPTTPDYYVLFTLKAQ
jgi:hypothetical protein